MTRIRNRRGKFDMPFMVALSTVLLILILPLLLYILQQRSNFKQHAQMTPPPVQEGCFYFPARCSDDPTKQCNPSDYKIVCPDMTLAPTISLTQQQPAEKVESSHIFLQVQQWFSSLFK